MKHTNIFITIALFMMLSSTISFSSETPNTSWKNYMFNMFSGAIQSYKSIANTIWNNEIGKYILTVATISTLPDIAQSLIKTGLYSFPLALYSRTPVTEYLTDLIIKPSNQTKALRRQIIEIPGNFWEQK